MNAKLKFTMDVSENKLPQVDLANNNIF